MKHAPSSPPAFALVATLAILSVVAILVVAYATTARTEGSASQNFAERERAQAIAQGMLNRILADHAQPELAPGKRLKPFAVNTTTKLPTPETDQTYNAVVPSPGIYRMEPMAELSTDNHLVRISKKKPNTGESESAFTPAAWAWARQELTPGDPDSAARLALFTPRIKDGTEVAPEWVDYLEVEPGGQTTSAGGQVPIGEVAYCIWDESGNFDINVAGKDPNINGVAPHNLGFEKLTIDPVGFLSLLDGRDGKRQRSNFALREISKSATTNDTGDDRWFFSVEELLARKILTGEKALNVTSSSRDFDVRPEWDGNRDGKLAEKFLRSFINNPEIFALFGDATKYPNASSRLVTATFNEQTLKSKLAAEGFPQTETWMQVVRLLAALRLSLPPFTNFPAPALPTPLPMNKWSDEDVYGIALNILQATVPSSDQNLHAYDRRAYGAAPFNDPNTRLGIRVGPYITEAALVAERINDTQVRLKAYYEVWNPYDIPLTKPNGTSIRYYFGNWTGGQWETSHTTPTGGIYAMTQRWDLPGTMKIGDTTKLVNPPAPRSFVVISPPERIVTWPLTEMRNLEIRTRPYIQNQDYWSTLINGASGSTEESSSYAVTIFPFYSGGGSDARYNVIHTFSRAKLNRKTSPTANTYTPVWHSFQIDDPRMGPFSRYSENYAANPPPPANADAESFQRYSWVAYPEEHSLFGIPKDPKIPENEKYVHPDYGDGFNKNFGQNWPPGFDFNRAMATFALPRRPFLNVGELGSVFANRPWRTLSFATTTVPTAVTNPSKSTGTLIQVGSKSQNYPTALLDYLTTVGTTTEKTTLNYKNPSGAPAGVPIIEPNRKERLQDKIWLFESVDTNKTTGVQTPTGNLRPMRGRINLNSATAETISRMLSAPYRLPRSWGLMNIAALNPKPITTTSPDSDIEVRLPDPNGDGISEDAELIAAEIVGDPKKNVTSIRPIRTMADLGKLKSIQTLHGKYPDPVVDAMIGRLAQFGTVRQQIYTVDIVARALNRKVEERRLSDPKVPRVVTAEVRFLARVYFDTFSRKGFVESIEYR